MTEEQFKELMNEIDNLRAQVFILLLVLVILPATLGLGVAIRMLYEFIKTLF